MEQKTKTLLLTGASGGIGRAVLPILASAGYNLILQAYSRAEELLSFVNKIGLENVRVIRQSLQSFEDVQQLKETIGQSVDVVVANAGISHSAPAHKLDHHQWQRTLDINLSVPFYLSQAFFNDMRANQFGRIVFISSVVGCTFVRGTSAYAASKAGLTGLARALAADWAAFGITVNCIAPGYMDVGLISQIPAEMLNYFKEKSAQNRLGPAHEIGHAIIFLASENCSFITGQTLHINGGVV
ncbi:MAG: SDR family NAD(P)-dependent oxidoreductase [Thermaurantimonas sp.]